MVAVVKSQQTEAEFCSLVEQSDQEQLIDLLRENHPVYNQRGATTVARMRGWVMLALARIQLTDAALPFVLEELDTGVDAYLVAAAAFALRSYPTQNPAFAPFVARAITNIRYRDERVSLQSYGGYAVGSTGTTPVYELLATLVWLGPHARRAVNEVELLRNGPTAFSEKYHSTVDEVLSAIRAGANTDHSSNDCCELPGGVKDLFSWMRTTRTSSQPIELTDFEDQDGRSITFGEFFRGRPSIVAFFYTRCDNPLKCSLTITKLGRIQELLKTEGLADQVNTAAVTYDPGFDLPDRIRKYGEHRGMHFAQQHRMLRAPDGFDSLRKHFKLGVNFIESLVNRHRIEVYILDTEGRIAGYFGRIQWNEKEVVQRAIEVMRENVSGKTSAGPQRSYAAPIFGTAIALGIALFPKCPLCWAAYLSLFGIAGLESIPYSPWLQPVLAILLLLNLTSAWFRARSMGRMIPFYLVIVGALALIVSKVFGASDTVGYAGVLFTLAGSVWGSTTMRNQRVRSSA
jgi:protein SCO1